MTDLEIRPFAEPVEVRSAAGGKLVLSGTAIRYGARSKDLGGFRERIMAGAATEAMQKGTVLALDEHRSERYLGSTRNATLRLIDTKDSLRYEVDLPDTAIGREVAALAERGDYTGSSFGFRSLAATWSKDEDGVPLRSVTAFAMLRDVGPTVTPAYETGAAEAALRCLPLESDRNLEVRSVLAAAAAGTLAALLEGDAIAVPVLGDDPIVVDEATVIHRRPPHWFL